VASWGQLIISATFGAIPCKTELAKAVPTDQIKANFITAADVAPSQKFLLPSFEKTKTSKAFPIIINGIIGANVRGKRPVYIEIKLGIRHNKNADSNPKIEAEIKSSALTMDPVINWFKK